MARKDAKNEHGFRRLGDGDLCKGLCGEPNVHPCKWLVPGLSSTPKSRDAQVPHLKRLHVYIDPTDALLHVTSSLG